MTYQEKQEYGVRKAMDMGCDPAQAASVVELIEKLGLFGQLPDERRLLVKLAGAVADHFAAVRDKVEEL
jgi:hypothetical protein